MIRRLVFQELILLATAALAQAAIPVVSGPGSQESSMRGTIAAPYRLLASINQLSSPLGDPVEKSATGADRTLEVPWTTKRGPQDSLRIQPGPQVAISRENTLAVQQLQPPVSSEAQLAFEKGRRAAAKGDSEEAIRQFQHALSIDPNLADAHNDLGVVLAVSGKLVEASDEFQSAIARVPDHPLALANLCIVLAKLDRYEDAGAIAVRALKIEPDNARIHFILAISLINGHHPAEALSDLERAAPEIPFAHVLAAQVLVGLGRRPEALDHLEQYMRSTSPDDAGRRDIQAWIDRLRAQ